jgi:hypothetical protein
MPGGHPRTMKISIRRECNVFSYLLTLTLTLTLLFSIYNYIDILEFIREEFTSHGTPQF